MADSTRSSLDTDTMGTEAPRKPGHNYLLLIGIDHYTHFPKLENAVADTQALKAILHEKYRFEAAYTVELYNEEATRANILSAIDRLTERIGPNDNLMIYYAGHGYYRQKLRIGYLVPAEAKAGAFHGLIPNSTIRDYIRAFSAHHIFLVVDSCFSGSLLHRDIQMEESVEALAEQVDRFPSRWGLAAGMIEKVADGLVGDHSPFAKSFLTYLKSNTASRLPVSEVIQYVSRITTYNADQTPIGGVLGKTEHMGGQFVFDLKIDEGRDWADTLAEGGLSALQQFLKTWPEGRFAEAATWQIASLNNTPRAYDAYLIKYPKGQFAKQADQQLRKAEERTAWAEAKQRDSISAYRDFLQEYPDSTFLKEANIRLKQLREGTTVPPPPKEEEKLIVPVADPVLSRPEPVLEEQVPDTATGPAIWQNPILRYGLLAVLALLIGGGIYWAIPKNNSPNYSQLIEAGKRQHDLGNREEALTLYERAQKRQNTTEVRELIDTVKEELKGEHAVEKPEGTNGKTSPKTEPDAPPNTHQNQYEQLIEEGKRLYQLKNYKDAKSVFEKAYSISTTREAKAYITRCDKFLLDEQFDALILRARRSQDLKTQIDYLERALKLKSDAKIEGWLKELKQKAEQGNKPTSRLRAHSVSYTPNPTAGKFRLRFSLSEIGSIRVRLLNEKGNEMLDILDMKFAGKFDQEINASRLPAGAYVIEISNGEQNAEIGKIEVRR